MTLVRWRQAVGSQCRCVQVAFRGLRAALTVPLVCVASLALTGVDAVAIPKPLPACRFVTLADARSLIGRSAVTATKSTKTHPLCLYVARSSRATLSVRALVDRRPLVGPKAFGQSGQSGEKTTVDGTVAWWSKPSLVSQKSVPEESFGPLVSWRKGTTFEVTVEGTSDNLGTAKKAMHLAFSRQ